MKFNLNITFRKHPEWQDQNFEVETGVPFFLVGSEGMYTLTAITPEADRLASMTDAELIQEASENNGNDPRYGRQS